MVCYCKKVRKHINTGFEGSSELFNTELGGVSSNSNLCFLSFALF